VRNPYPARFPPQAAKAARPAGRHPLGPGRSEGVQCVHHVREVAESVI
jgi:hypothetical protein